MEDVAQLSVPTAKIAIYETDYTLCIICQTDEVAEFVTKPTAYDKLLNCIKERASYGDKQYSEVARRLGRVGSVKLKAVGATLHQKCHKDAGHADKCQRAKIRYEQQISSKQSLPTSSSTLEFINPAFTRSQSTQYRKDVFLFRDNEATYKDPLHQIATENAGRGLKEAIKQHGNEKLAVKLNMAINTEDAHAIDI